MSNETALMKPRLPSLIVVEEEEGYTKKELNEAKKNDFEEHVKSQYENLYRIIKENFVFLTDHNSNLELIAEFDSISKELVKFTGWLETKHKGNTAYNTYHYAKIELNPVKTPSGLVYYFKGTVEWNDVSDYKGRIHPISAVPVYGLPSGRIIELRPTSMNDSKYLFDKAKVEHRSLEIRLGDE